MIIAKTRMMTLMALAQKYLNKGSEPDDDRWMSGRQVQLDQVVKFFETEWDGEKGLRWTADADKVRDCVKASLPDRQHARHCWRIFVSTCCLSQSRFRSWS